MRHCCCLQMADKERKDRESENVDQTTGENGSHNGNTLEAFVTDHYQQQKDAGKLDSTDEISDERTDQFFSRALAESRRMNAEVGKSNKKLDALHAEFGLDMVNAWQAEHASEVLNQHEQQLINEAKYQGAVGDSAKNNG